MPVPVVAAVQIGSRLVDILRLDIETLLPKLVQVGSIWLLAWIGFHLLKLTSRRILQAVDDGDDTTLTVREQRGQTIAQLLRSVGRVVILASAVLLTANVFVNIAPLLAGAGILGLAISFGAQSLVKDVISGFFILFENTFAVGDVIEVAGYAGVVERMTMRVVLLRDLQGTLHTIPNGQIGAVSNKTRGWSRAVVEVGIAYDTDVDRALQVFQELGGEAVRDSTIGPMLDGEPEVLGIEALGDSAVTIRTLLRTVPGKQWAVARAFRRLAKKRLDQEGIEIPFPQRTVHVRTEGAGVATREPA